MFSEILDSLTAEDRKALAALGVPGSRISEWKHNNRLPTRPQALALAHVKGIEYSALERELTLLEAERANPALLAKVRELCILCLIEPMQKWAGLARHFAC